MEGNDPNLVLLKETVIKWVLSFIKTNSEIPSSHSNSKGLSDAHSHTEGRSIKALHHFIINYLFVDTLNTY